MKAMALEKVGRITPQAKPLVWTEIPDPVPGPGQILVRISVCGVCHTELDEIEGRTPPGRFPIVPGHQVIGRVEALGPGARIHPIGARVGVAWIHAACGHCEYCRAGNENLCPDFVATGRDVHGGYAQTMVVGVAFAHPIPDAFSDVTAAPLLCAGAIGYRSLRLCGLKDGEPLGLIGFGASARLVLQLAQHQLQHSRLHVFTRSPHEALELGAHWAGGIDDRVPGGVQAIIDTTPVWRSVVRSLGNLRPGGRLVINAIRKENDDRDLLLEIQYEKHLWMEKEIKSVANVTRADVRDLLALAARIPLRPAVEEHPLQDANRVLVELKVSRPRGSHVLRVA